MAIHQKSPDKEGINQRRNQKTVEKATVQMGDVH